MNSIKDSIKVILWRFFMWRGKNKLNRQDPLAQKIYLAIEDTLNNRSDSEEKRRFALIEQIRSKHTNNPTPISVVDYGAGEPGELRSEEEAAGGVAHLSTYGAVSLGSKPKLWAVLLSKLVRRFQPETGIELGTCIGVSAAYEGVAMQLNHKGKLISLEGSPAIADLARANLNSLQMDRVSVVTGRFIDTLPEIIKTHAPIDYVFIDGHHDEKATWMYYQLLLPYLSPQALLVFDDISWSPGMKKVWKQIASDEHITLSVDLNMMGICIVRKPVA